MTIIDIFLRDFLAMLWPPTELQLVVYVILLLLALTSPRWERHI